MHKQVIGLAFCGHIKHIFGQLMHINNMCSPPLSLARCQQLSLYRCAAALWQATELPVGSLSTHFKPFVQ